MHEEQMVAHLKEAAYQGRMLQQRENIKAFITATEKGFEVMLLDRLMGTTLVEDVSYEAVKSAVTNVLSLSVERMTRKLLQERKREKENA